MSPEFIFTPNTVLGTSRVNGPHSVAFDCALTMQLPLNLPPCGLPAVSISTILQSSMNMTKSQSWIIFLLKGNQLWRQSNKIMKHGWLNRFNNREKMSQYEQDERINLLEGQLSRENQKHSLLDYLNANGDVDMV